MKTLKITTMLLLSACALPACVESDVGDEDVADSSDAIVAGAAYTTFVDSEGCLHGNGKGINCNHYRSKQDVYINGGPSRAGLSDGEFYFTVLTPGSQNGGFVQGAEGNLSDDVAHGENDLGSGDSVADRTFRVEQGAIVENLGTHLEGETPNGKLALQLFPFDDTANNGGVYILALCRVGATSPSQCKFDAFKVREMVTEPPPPPPPPPPVCGDGTMDAGESCDDGNTVDDDACANDCTVPPPPPPPESFCGDGVVDMGEACDDGNTDNTDGCSTTCECGIVVVDEEPAPLVAVAD